MVSRFARGDWMGSRSIEVRSKPMIWPIMVAFSRSKC